MPSRWLALAVVLETRRDDRWIKSWGNRIEGGQKKNGTRDILRELWGSPPPPPPPPPPPFPFPPPCWRATSSGTAEPTTSEAKAGRATSRKECLISKRKYNKASQRPKKNGSRQRRYKSAQTFIVFKPKESKKMLLTIKQHSC